jgi:hypothetical protein
VAVVVAVADVVDMARTFVAAVVELEDIVNVENVENIVVHDFVVDDNVVRYLVMDLMALNHERTSIQRSM